MRKKVLLALLVFSASLPASATAITGAIDSDPGDGMFATAGWSDGNASLSWSVKQLGSSWIYDYGWSTTRKELSHIIFGVSETFTAANVLEGTSSGWELGWFGDEGNSNPGIPDLIYGMKWEGDGLYDMFRLVSDRAPMWGDFYAKDGKDGGDNVYAYNSSYGLSSDALPEGTAPYGFILVPDTVTSPIPEPHTLALFGIGSLMILGKMGKRTRQETVLTT